MEQTRRQLRSKLHEFRISEGAHQQKSESTVEEFLKKAKAARETFKDEDLEEPQYRFKIE